MVYEPKAAAGIVDPDETQTIQVVHDGVVNATRRQQTLGFNRFVSIVIPGSTTAMQRRFLADFIGAKSKAVTYGPETIPVMPKDQGLVASWLHACEYCREFNMGLIDSRVHVQWPSDIAVLDTDMYTSKIVEITGTSEAPQTFSTGIDPLDVDMWGNAFPTLNPATQKADVWGTPMNGSQFVPCFVALPTIVGGMATWQVFISDFGPASPVDGKYWIKFTISISGTP